MERSLNDVIPDLKYEYIIYGYENEYDPNRVVFNKTKGYWVKIHCSPFGYDKLKLALKNRQKNQNVHQLLCKAFIGWNYDTDDCVTRHINHIRNDNRLSNLTYGTHQDNMQDKVLAGRQAITKYWTGKMGTDHISCRNKYICIDRITGMVVEEYIGTGYLNAAGFNHSHVFAVAQGKRKQHKGFSWRIEPLDLNTLKND